MPKNWWFKLDFKVWRTDSDLRRCSLETRGFWLECICAMHEAEDSKIEGTYEEIGWLIGCAPEVVARCILDLKRTETADVFIGNGVVKITSRRMKRELKERKQTRLRVKNHRSSNGVSNASVTPVYEPPLTIVKSKESEKEEDIKHSHSEALAVYNEFFPEAPQPSLHLQTLLELITDIPRWRRTLTYWKNNNYRAQSVGKMIDHYNEQDKKNGSDRKRNTDNQGNPDDRVESIGFTEVRYLQ